ncbi:MAG: signal peptide peptidase SppA [Oscillatoriales cyanobacterium RM2_1_1]|nr:signal peptide peptidase SppA [Oscillatoriales cyanobacterium SM2_3_0]NJO47558.1 signal peptide peptidase SppA [Oscillatoriales cyanobacterium RM2_1_1]
MKDFLKYTTASLLGNLLALVLVLGAGIGGLMFLIGIAASQKSEPLVKHKSVLVLDLSIDISDYEPEYTTSQILQQSLAEAIPSQLKLRTVLNSLEEASRDDQIVGLYIQGSNTPSTTGFANLKEVRAALEQFRESGKPIIAYDTDWTESEYYLASVADTLAVNPLGSVELNGLSSQVMFLAGALQKYGVGVQVTRVGKYKSAVEPFLLKQMSPENRAQTQQLLSDIWGEFLRNVGEDRDLPPAQLQKIVDTQGILIADEALNQKVVDKVAYFDEVVTQFKALTGEEELTLESENPDNSFRQVSLQSYGKTPDVVKVNRGNPSSQNKVAIIYAEGSIVDGEGIAGQIGGDRLAQELRLLRLDDDIKAIVLRVNSPGGSATASEVIGREVELLAQKKPVVVSMGNFAASGGYWISMAAGEIFAEPTTITGSIGVFGVSFNVKDIANQNGITWDTVKTGRYADINTNVRPKTPEELQRLQKVVDLIYERFLTQVAQSRQIPRPKVEEIAQGRVWSGTQAKTIGLVDQIGGIEAAISAAVKRAELGDDWKLEEYPEVKTLEDRILRNLTEARAEVKPAPELDGLSLQLMRLREELEQFKTLNDPRDIYMQMPFNLKIE